VEETPGAIGYVEYGYAKQHVMDYHLMQGKAGQFIAPTAANFKNAAANAKSRTPTPATGRTTRSGSTARNCERKSSAKAATLG